MDIKEIFRSHLIQPSFFWICSGLLAGVILLVGIQSFRASEQAAFSEFNQRQLLVARQTATGIKGHIESLAGSIRSLARTPHISTFDDAIVRPIVDYTFQELEQLGASDLGIIDAHGILQYAAGSLALEGTDFSWRKYVNQARNVPGSLDRGYFLQFIEFKGIDAGKRGVLLCVPIGVPEAVKGFESKSDRFRGAVVCTFPLDLLIKEFIAPSAWAEYNHMFLFTDQGEVLWAPDETMFGKKIARDLPSFSHLNAILAAVYSGEDVIHKSPCVKYDGSRKAFDRNPVMHLVAATPVKLSRQIWPLVLMTPESEVRGLVKRVFVKQVLFMGLAFAALLAATSYTLFISNRYKKRLEQDVATKSDDLSASHHRFITLLDSLDAYVFAIDMQSSEILYGNRALLDQFGDVVGKVCWQALQVGQTGRCDFCPRQELLTPEGEPTGVHSWEIQNTRTKQWWQVQGRAIRWIDNRIVTLEVAINVTERKLAEIELKRSHMELGTFCGIMKEIGTMESLDRIGALLLERLGRMLNGHPMALMLFNKYRDTLFMVSDSGVKIIDERSVVAFVAQSIDKIDGITTLCNRVFEPPVIPESFPNPGKQTILPFQVNGNSDGALIIACESEHCCQEKELDLIELILMQVSGVLKRAVRHQEEILPLQHQLETTCEYCGIVGKAPEMQVVYKLINDIAPTDATVLIQGESGTGKELVARAIHYKSHRRHKPFIVINCAAYPSTLLESELFGHEKGAFTGATNQKTGRFEQASGGTVFLDEIGEVSLSAQIKLLRVLQTQKFERLGGTHTLAVNVRILSATNKNLIEEVKKGTFREDLYYRLNVIPINLPPLRNRRNDIPLLIEHFQHKFTARQGQHTKGISSQALRRFLNYHWPGNVRELENSVEHAVILSKGRQMDVAHLPDMLIDIEGIQNGAPSKGTLMENEKKAVINALNEQNWNKSRAALQLNISRSALYDKIKKYHISKPAE